MAKTPVNAHLYCPSCDSWFDVDRKLPLPDVCPHCGKQITTMTCNRCGYTWKLRRRQYPKVCPNLECKSAYYSTVKFKYRGDKE